MKTPKQFSRVNTLLNQVDRLRKKRDAAAKTLQDLDANLADLEVEWADLQKEISSAIFGRTTLDELRAHESPAKSTKKTSKKRKKRKKSIALRKSNNLGSRDEIQAAAKARDARIASLLSSKKSLSLHELHATVQNGSLEQIQTSLKRLRKRGLIQCEGKGRTARYVRVLRKTNRRPWPNAKKG